MKHGEVGSEERHEKSAPATQGFGVDDIQKIVNAAVTSAISAVKKEDGVIVDQFDKLDPDDLISPAEVWYAPFVSYIITTDKRGGREVKLPFNMPSLVFKHHGTNTIKKPNTKESEVVNMSRFLCESKTLSKWLESSSFYKVAIFKELKGVKTVDVKLVQLIQKYIHAFANSNQGFLFAEAHKLNLPVDVNNTSAQDLKIAIATHYARRDWQGEIEQTASRILNSKKEELLKDDNNATSSDELSLKVESLSLEK